MFGDISGRCSYFFFFMIKEKGLVIASVEVPILSSSWNEKEKEMMKGLVIPFLK